MGHLTKKEAFSLHKALKDVKISKLEQSKTMAYLALKIKLTEMNDEVSEAIKKINTEVQNHLGVKEGDSIDAETSNKYYTMVNELSEKEMKEKTEIDSHILSDDEIYKSIINISANENITSEDLATIYKFLRLEETKEN